MTRSATALLPLLLALASLAACGDDAGPRTPAAIVVTPDAPRVPIGESRQLTATVVDAEGRAIEDEPLTFASSDLSILTVSTTGLLTSVGPVGSSIITVTGGDLERQVEARVVLTPSSMFVSPGSLDLESDESALLSVTVSDENGDSIPGAAVEFQTSDPAVADLIPVGIVTGLAPGTATITVTSGEHRREVPVTVTQVARSIVLAPPSLVLPPGGTGQLAAAVLDLGGDPIPEAVITWTSSDEDVLTVDATGGIQAAGTDRAATVVASSGGLSAESRVYVGTPPAGDVLATLEAPAWRLAVTAGGRYLATTTGPELLSGALPGFSLPVSIPLPGRSLDVTVNQAGTRAYVSLALPGPEVNGVSVLDLGTDQPIDLFYVPQGSPFLVLLSPDESRLLVGTHIGVSLLDAADGATLAAGDMGQIDCLVRDPARPVAYACVFGGRVLEIGFDDGLPIRELPFPGAVAGLAVAPDGSRLYAIEEGGAVQVRNLETGAEEPSLPIGGTGVDVSPDGKFLYVMDFDRMRIVDAVAGIPLGTIELAGWPRWIRFAGDVGIVVNNTGAPSAAAVHFVR